MQFYIPFSWSEFLTWGLAERHEGNASSDGWLPRADDRGGSGLVEEKVLLQTSAFIPCIPRSTALLLQEGLFTEKLWLAPGHDLRPLLGTCSPRASFPLWEDLLHPVCKFHTNFLPLGLHLRKLRQEQKGTVEDRSHLG